MARSVMEPGSLVTTGDHPPPIACEAQCDSGGTVSRPHRVTRVARAGSDQQRPVSGNS